MNVPPLERLVTVGAGSIAALLGARSRSLPGALLAAAGIVLVARGVSGRCPFYRGRAMGSGVDLHRSIVINAPRREVYRVWRDLAGLSRFFEHLESVDPQDERVSQWVVAIGPVRLQWLAEIVDEEPERRLTWQTIPGADLEHRGAIELSDGPDGRSTVLSVDMSFHTPAAAVTRPFKSLVRALTTNQLAADLIRLRQFIETGEIATAATRPAPQPPAPEAPHATQTPPPPAVA